MEATAAMLGNMNPASRTNDDSLRNMARFAGFLYLVIVVAAIVAHFYVPSQIIVPGDAAATANNILASESLFRAGIVSEVVVLLSEIVLSVVLYILFKPVSKTLSLVAALLRLAMTMIHGINLLNYFFALLLLSGADYLAVFQPDQLRALALFFLNAHHYGFEIGILFFGPHVTLLGYLVFKSGYFPRAIGLLFIVAGCGYLLSSAAMLLVPGYDTTPVYLALPIAMGEIVFPLWLLIKGVNVAEWHRRALAAA